MKNILIISALFPPEPVVSAKLSEDIANFLSKINNVTVIAPLPTRPFGFDLTKPNKIKKLYDLISLDSYTCPESNLYGRLRESYSFGIACKKYIKKNHNQIDLIYMSSWPIFAQYFTVKIAYKFNIPITTHVQDIYPESLSTKMPILGVLVNLIFIPLDKIILGKSKIVIAISEKMKKHLASSRQISLKKIKVVKNWQDEEMFINFEKTKKSIFAELNLFTFMYMGNIGPVAGVDLLIESFSQANLENCRLLIAGSGSKRIQLEKMVSSRKIERVKFVDVPDGMVPEIQGSADVMLLPIKKGAASSSIPSKLPAYMFSKKPIIASVDIDSDSARVINEAKAGWVIEPENIDMLIDAMREASLTKKSELELKGKNGFNFAMKNLSKRNNLKQLVKAILE
jgi:glycosyltransferase involved in cell wall biosynthesis